MRSRQFNGSDKGKTKKQDKMSEVESRGYSKEKEKNDIIDKFLLEDSCGESLPLKNRLLGCIRNACQQALITL